MEKAFVICSCGGWGDDQWESKVGVMFDAELAAKKVDELNVNHARLVSLWRSVQEFRKVCIGKIAVEYEESPNKPREPGYWRTTPELLRKYQNDMLKWKIVDEQVGKRNAEKESAAHAQLANMMREFLEKLPAEDVEALGYPGDGWEHCSSFDTDVTYYMDEVKVIK